jgi:hypothetical protein
MDGDITFALEARRVRVDLRPHRARWETNLELLKKRRINKKIKVNRRSAFGKSLGWPLELFTKDIKEPPKFAELPEPEPAKPDPRLSSIGPRCDPVAMFRQALAKPLVPTRPQVSGRPQQDLRKPTMTEAATVVGDEESFGGADEELYSRVDEEDFEDPVLDLEKIDRERVQREELAKKRQTVDSYLLEQVFDSFALQGENCLAADLGSLYPWMLDAGNNQAQHVFWKWQAVCPQLRDHFESKEFRPVKLFVPVDRSNASFMTVIRWFAGIDELAARTKRAMSAYYCCFALFYGQKPKQSVHVEHECLRHDLDERIIDKPNYDHAEDYKHDNSVNTAKKALGYVKENADELDEVDAYINAWKRLAGKGRWWFTDKHTGQEWIAVPWLWKHTEPTESTYLKHFDRCFAEKHYSIYCSRPLPDFEKADPEAVFEIKVSVLARKAACLHTVGRTFQDVARVIWWVNFKQTPDEAKKQHDQAVDDWAKVEAVFADELPDELAEKKRELELVCKQFQQRADLVLRAANIIFERAPRRSKPIELEIGEKSQAQLEADAEKARWADNWQARKDFVNHSRRIENQPEELKGAIRAKEAARKAEYRKKKKLGGSTAI